MTSKNSFSLVLLAAVIPCWIALADDSTRDISVNVHEVQGPLNTSFKECVGAGRANEGLRADWQAQLRMTKAECGFKYIRFHGLLHDDMAVYREDSKGNPVYNWQYIDRLYDFLLEIGMKPFVEISFMPKDLARGKKTVFWWKGNVTMPKSDEKWSDLIRNLMTHWRERYGHEEVKSWYFEVWNEPDLPEYFFDGTREDYFKLYTMTAQAIKAVSPEYRVGGPASAKGITDTFDEAFIQYCHSNQVPLDFVSTHCYGSLGGFIDEFGQSGTVMEADPLAVIKRMTGERAMIDRSPMPHLPLHFTEWGPSFSPSDWFHDSYLGAAYILDKVKGAHRSVDSMAFWVFSDIFEESGPPLRPFHGGFGNITVNDIKKSGYFAYQFLNKLGPQELKNADTASWICKDSDESVQALVWNFTPIVPPAGTTDQVYFRQDRQPKPAAPARLTIAGLPAGKYELKVYHVGYRKNDPFSIYLDWKMPTQLSRQQVAALQAEASGKPEVSKTIAIKSGAVFEHEFPLRENDVYLTTLKRIKK